MMIHNSYTFDGKTRRWILVYDVMHAGLESLPLNFRAIEETTIPIIDHLHWYIVYEIGRTGNPNV